MLSPQLVLEFQQQFKQLQIHAGLGVTEENISKVADICIRLAEIADDLYVEAHSVKDEAEVIETREKLSNTK